MYIILVLILCIIQGNIYRAKKNASLILQVKFK